IREHRFPVRRDAMFWVSSTRPHIELTLRLQKLYGLSLSQRAPGISRGRVSSPESLMRPTAGVAKAREELATGDENRGSSSIRTTHREESRLFRKQGQPSIIFGNASRTSSVGLCRSYTGSLSMCAKRHSSDAVHNNATRARPSIRRRKEATGSSRATFLITGGRSRDRPE